MFESVPTPGTNWSMVRLLCSVALHVVAGLLIGAMRFNTPAPSPRAVRIVSLTVQGVPRKASVSRRPAEVPRRSSPRFVPAPQVSSHFEARGVQLDSSLPELTLKPESVLASIEAGRIRTEKPLALGAFGGFSPAARPEGTAPEACESCRQLLAAAVVAKPEPHDPTVARPRFEQVQTAQNEPIPATPLRPSVQPVVIEFKPRPEYSDAARAQRIEGEVVIRVRFPAAGPAKAESLVEGLGFGLDESALNAVPEIRFRPAKRDGQPIDQVATVHFIFKLAY